MNREFDWFYSNNNNANIAKWEHNPEETKEKSHNIMNKKPTKGCDKESNTRSVGIRPRHNQWGTILIVQKGECALN
jgi:hypothetical protein